jgi:hypothetical protein
MKAAYCLWSCLLAAVALYRAAARVIWGVQANRITLQCSCYVPTFSAAPLCLDSDDGIILQVCILYFVFMHSTFTGACAVQGDEAGVCRTWSLDMSAWTASSSDKAGVAAAINQVTK